MFANNPIIAFNVQLISEILFNDEFSIANPNFDYKKGKEFIIVSNWKR